MNQIPEKLINFRVYHDGTFIPGTTDVELPDFQAMSDTVSGAGIAGEVDAPTLGHFQSMQVQMNLRVMARHMGRFFRQRSHDIEVRGSQQVFDASAGVYRTQSVRVAIRGTPKNFGLGNATPGSGTGSSMQYEITRIKVWIGGRVEVEIDKYNYIANIGGQDFLADVRADLGI